MSNTVQVVFRFIAVFAAGVLYSGATVWADDIERIPFLPAYRQECAACHVPYPPGMLPAASWKQVMQQLPQHYGSDASLDAATVNQLATWLTANAASPTSKPGRQMPPQDRITLSNWFVHEHDEVAVSTWKLPAVKSAANCAACHTRSNQGTFDERHLRIPR